MRSSSSSPGALGAGGLGLAAPSPPDDPALASLSAFSNNPPFFIISCNFSISFTPGHPVGELPVLAPEGGG